MASTTLEPRPAMAPYDWRQSAWLEMELVHVRALSRQAGWYAYQGPRWRKGAIRQEALRFLGSGGLLSPQRRNSTLVGIVVSQFTRGWRNRERAERFAPPGEEQHP